MNSVSCIYEGTIRHRRHRPSRSFAHRIALFYLDLAELPRLLRGRLVARRPGVLRFRRRDYLGPASISLDDAVRELVLARTGTLCSGPIRILTQLRSFGHCFNPVSFYYCFDRSGDDLEAVVAEVTNTPWGERHAYVIPGDTGTLGKALHVSPFQAMDQRYLVRAGTPGERLGVHVESRRDEAVCFDATLALRRTELTARSAARVAARHPAASLRVLALIYAHAVGLKLAGATVYPHPRPHHLTPHPHDLAPRPLHLTPREPA